MNEIELPQKKEVVVEKENKKPLSFKELVSEIFTFLTHTSLLNIIIFIFELCLIALVVIVFKFPVELVIDLGPKLFNFIGDAKLLSLLINVWTLFFNIIYTIFGIYAYYKICSVRFIDLSKRK